MGWINKLLSANGEVSSRRFNMLLAGFSMSIALVSLVFMGAPAESLWAITIPLAALGGAPMVTEKKNAEPS